MINKCKEIDMANPDFDNVLKRIGDYMYEKLSEDFNVINFAEKKKEKIATEINKMISSGITDNVRQTSTGILIGNPEVVKRLNMLKEELNRLNSRKCEDNV